MDCGHAALGNDAEFERRRIFSQCRTGSGCSGLGVVPPGNSQKLELETMGTPTIVEIETN